MIIAMKYVCIKLLRDEKIVWSRKETIYGIRREYWRFNTAGLKGLSKLAFKIYEVVFNNLQEDRPGQPDRQRGFVRFLSEPSSFYSV